jgi:hypothetical protein
MAEIKLSALKGQCIDYRIPAMTLMKSKIAAWETHRNNAMKPFDWQFRTFDARIKLKKIYQNT